MLVSRLRQPESVPLEDRPRRRRAQEKQVTSRGGIGRAAPRQDRALFERRVVVVPDVAWRGRVSTAEWGAVVERMTPLLAGDRIVEAFGAGFDAIGALLASKGASGGRARQGLSDTLVQGDDPEAPR